jgi:hypothetical protein
MYGEKLRYLEQQPFWKTGHPVALRMGMPVDQGESPDQLHAEADKLFEGLAGETADQMQFSRVIIRPDDGTDSGQVSIFGFKVGLKVDVGTGPIDPEDDGVAYDKSMDSTWSRDGAQPQAPAHIEEYNVPDGERFALTSAVEDFPRGDFVYDCLTCHGPDAPKQFAACDFKFLRTAVIPRASRDGLTKVGVHVFLRARRSLWDFPLILNFKIVRRADGHWIAPNFLPQALEASVNSYLAKAHAQGARWREQVR